MRSPGSWVVYDSVAPRTMSARTVPWTQRTRSGGELEHLAAARRWLRRAARSVRQPTYHPGGIDPRAVRREDAASTPGMLMYSRAASASSRRSDRRSSPSRARCGSLVATMMLPCLEYPQSISSATRPPRPISSTACSVASRARASRVTVRKGRTPLHSPRPRRTPIRRFVPTGRTRRSRVRAPPPAGRVGATSGR